MIRIKEPQQSSFALFNLGFRPFFLLSALSAIVLMTLWGLLYSNVIQLNNYYGFINWHSHEMLFGYTSAVIAGFLLTAVRNWTNVDTITRTPLAFLAAIWLSARILPFTPAPGWLIAIVDVLFFFFLILAIIHPILKARQWHNLIMVAILFVFMVADILVQSQHLGWIANGIIAGNTLALYSIVMIIQVVTGRVLPFFTRVVVPNTDIVARPLLEKTLALLLVLLALADVMALPGLISSVLAACLVIAHCLRVLPWFSRPVLQFPILWVLYAGYVWLIIGFIMKMLAGVELVANNLAVHSWTIGAIGIITYGMMARVALGHTGRDMLASSLVVTGFYLLMIAALVRVILPLFAMTQYTLWVEVSGALWVLAFLLFAIVYWPILTRPRADGQPG